MNLAHLTTSSNGLLLLLGVLILVAGGLARAFWLRRGHLHAGAIGVIIVLLACALVTIGLFRNAFPALSGDVSVSEGTGAPGSSTQLSPTATVAGNQGNTIGVSSTTPGNSGQQAFASVTGLSANNRLFPLLALIGAGLTFVIGLLMVLYERRQQGFNPSSSPGILYTGAGVFVLIASVVVPNLPAQFAPAKITNASIAVLSTNGALPTRIMARTSTPSATPVQARTSTAMPSLTPSQASTPTSLFTPIAYAYSTDTSGTAPNCNVTAQTTLSLRGSPSTEQQAIGRVFAGSLLPVTGQSADRKWWRVLSIDEGSTVEGWVSADWVTPGSGCSVGAVAIIGPTLPPTRTPITSNTTQSTIPPTVIPPTSIPPTLLPSSQTPIPTNTPRPTHTPSSTSTPQPSPTATFTASSTPDIASIACVVMTTANTDLRADPSTLHAPIARIPPATGMVADLNSADGAWWHVTYAAPDRQQKGWVSAESVFAASACLKLPTAVKQP